MTTVTQAPPTIKFTGLSPLTTALVRQRTQLLQNLGTIKVGRTVLTFRMPTEELDELFDKLIQTEIPGSGASSKEVGRLRQLRRDLSAERTGLAEGTGVTITYGEPEPEGVDRDELIAILALIWARTEAPDDVYDEVHDLRVLVGAGDYPKGASVPIGVDEARTWLAEHL